LSSTLRVALGQTLPAPRAVMCVTPRNELGAAVAVVVENQLVVDLWGGTANPKTRQPWLEDTMVNMFSVTKGVAALAVAHAHSRISGRFPGFRAMRMQTTSLMKPTLSNWLVHGRP
jgi:hypothetical protein